MSNILVFDLDDTLYPESQFVESGFRAVSVIASRELGIKDFHDLAMCEFVSGNRSMVFDTVLRKQGVSNAQPIVQRMIDVYREHFPNIQLFLDAAWALNFYCEAKKMAILTDGYLVTQKNKVRALGVESMVETVVYSDQLGRDNWKPSPVPYKEVAARLGCEPTDCVYVADNPKKDFVTAKELGWTTVRVIRAGGVYSNMTVDTRFEAHATITSLHELAQLV